MSMKKKVFWIAAFIIIAAVAIVICVSFITRGQTEEFDGTLVQANHLISGFL